MHPLYYTADAWPRVDGAVDVWFTPTLKILAWSTNYVWLESTSYWNQPLLI